MIFGGWSIDEELFKILVNDAKPGDTLVELGSGAASPLLAAHMNVVSYEHAKKWLQADRPVSWTQHHAPLIDGWYDPAVLERTLPVSYQTLLIDGPPGGERRLGMLKHLELFDWSARVIVDDVHRKEERRLRKQLVHEIRKVRHCKPRSVKTAHKAFSIL